MPPFSRRAVGWRILLPLMGVGCATSQSEGPVTHEGTVRAKLEQARVLRTSGHGDAALSLLNEALKMEARSAAAPDPGLQSLRDAELAGAAETVDADLRADLDAAAPLAAQKRLAALGPLLDQSALRPIADKARARIAAAGQDRCARLSAAQKGDTPYLARLVVDYCARVGGSFSAPSPAEQTRGLRVSGRLAHATEAQHQIVDAWLADVFRASPWYAADAADLSAAQLGGSYDARLERRRVTVTVPYRAVIHSTATRSTLGPLGPSVDITTETERIFEYEAERYDARYGVDATVTLEIGGGPPLVVNVKHADSKRAFEHDVRFPDANVYPQRANLPDVNAWLTTFLGTKRSPLLRKLRGRWAKAFCGHSSYTPEEAARCLQAGQRVPQAEQALAATFGGDGQMVVDDLARSRADERQPAAARKAPEVQEVPQVDVGESI